MPVHATYANLKAKKEDAPWYTRWVWWLVAAGLLIIVLAIWYFAKMQEANARAAAKRAQEQATKAKLEALAEQDIEKAAELRERARLAEAVARDLVAEANKTAKARAEIEKSIKGASSWDELDAIEEDLE